MHHRRLKKTIRRRLKLFSLLSLILLFAFTGLWIYSHWPDPPVGELKAAGDALTLARNSQADKYAPGLFRETSGMYNAAMSAWKAENQRFFLNRDFDKTRELALKAAEKGLKAYENASEKARTIHHTTGATLDELAEIVTNFELFYSPLPLKKTLRESFNKAVLLLTEARLAREKKDFHLAESKLTAAKIMLLDADQKARSMLEEYFSSFPSWKKLAEEAIARSAARNSSLIVVDKMAHKCMVYDNGRLKFTFDAEFGPKWIGNKQHKGDQATPEGTYQIVHKKDRRKTIYYKALLLNYPNVDDRARFRKNVEAGRISSRSEAGGSIEIHGHGGRGFDWTNGCIALQNKDMDIVYNMASDTTPVVIVGSLEPLEKYYKNAGQGQNSN